jgi:hypothetical protein
MSTRRKRLHGRRFALGSGFLAAAGLAALAACGGGHVPLPALSPATVGDTGGAGGSAASTSCATCRCAATATRPTRATPTAR